MLICKVAVVMHVTGRWFMSATTVYLKPLSVPYMSDCVLQEWRRWGVYGLLVRVPKTIHWNGTQPLCICQIALTLGFVYNLFNLVSFVSFPLVICIQFCVFSGLIIIGGASVAEATWGHKALVESVPLWKIGSQQRMRPWVALPER